MDVNHLSPQGAHPNFSLLIRSHMPEDVNGLQFDFTADRSGSARQVRVLKEFHAHKLSWSSLISFWPWMVSFLVRNWSYLFVNSSLARIQSQMESSLQEERIREESVRIAKIESFMSCLLNWIPVKYPLPNASRNEGMIYFVICKQM